MGSIQPLQNAIDLTHHLNAHSKARHPSPLKDILKFMAYDGMVSLAGGDFWALHIDFRLGV
jgi:aromatic amino acid aminotransferase I